MNVVIAGGSGFLGQAFMRHLLRKGHSCVILTRTPRTPIDVAWDGKTRGDWCKALEGADVVINLTGRSINCVHNDVNRRDILQSRVDSVLVIRDAIKACVKPPTVWIQAGAASIYGSGNDAHTEASPLGETFLAKVAQEWEAPLQGSALPEGVRYAILRLGIVLGPGEGVLVPLRRMANLFLGGAAGQGTQYMSWIHIDDVMAMMNRCITDASIQGAYNATAPGPVTNREFMSTLRSVMGRPWSPPVPAFAVKIGARHVMKTEPALALDGMHAVPARWLSSGFTFQFPDLKSALTGIMSRWPSKP